MAYSNRTVSPNPGDPGGIAGSVGQPGLSPIGHEAYTHDNIIEQEIAAFGPFKSAVNKYQGTYQKLAAMQDPKSGRKYGDVYGEGAPLDVQPWQCRIGAARFYVPPLNINVSQTFRAGSLGIGAIRQPNSPKFNSGHSETQISMTIYFPTHDAIWGFPEDSTTIDFANASDAEIDHFLSSFRGLIAQFKYAPFLPIKNDYLNSAYNIQAVALQSITVSTVEGFPFCLAAQLNMFKFNHKVYLPMVENFESAIHYGRYRSYMGRCAAKLEDAASQDFLMDLKTAADANPNFATLDPKAQADFYTKQRAALMKKYFSGSDNKVTFDKIADLQNNGKIDFYYPDHDPARVILPDQMGWLNPSAMSQYNQEPSWWKDALRGLGLDIANVNVPNFRSVYDSSLVLSKFPLASTVANPYTLAIQFFKTQIKLTSLLNKDNFDKYLAHALAHKDPGISDQEATKRAYLVWMTLVYQFTIGDPYLQTVFDYQEFRSGQGNIAEWEVPMAHLDLDYSNVIINGVSASLGNNLMPLQIQMEQDATYQHLGGLDSTVNVDMTIFGEADLIKLRLMFEHISKLAMLEQNHGTLGFLGIKNILSALCAIKYCVPKTLEVDTIPNYPHVYSVRMSFVDFDIFQQKREMLSSAQQQELVDAFGKRNPFLRIKQLWGCVDAETEVLTIDGWKTYDQLIPGLKILTLNHETGLSEWQECQAVNKFEVDTRMLSIEGKVHSSLTSGDHRWPTLHKKRGNIKDGNKKRGYVIGEDRVWVDSYNLNSNDNLIVAAPSGDLPVAPKYSDDFVEICAWLWTEGTMEIRPGRNGPRIRIHQSHKANLPYVIRIRRALTNLYGPASIKLGGRIRDSIPRWRESQRKDLPGMTLFCLNSVAAESFINIVENKIVSLEFIRSLTSAQLELFIHISIRCADGYSPKGRGGSITQSDPARIVPIEYAAILAGYGTGTTYADIKAHAPTHKKDFYHSWGLRLRERTTYRAPAEKWKKWVPYRGIIWCPTTPNGSWMARRNGDSFFTGNSINTYPDMPLAVRDDAGNIVGMNEPDYYFDSYYTIDPEFDDLKNVDVDIVHAFGNMAENGQGQFLESNPSKGRTLRSGNTIVASNLQYNEIHASNIQVNPYTAGLVPPSIYAQPYLTNNGKGFSPTDSDPVDQASTMLQDSRYRDKTGRMVRAFPTYMLWLINEGGIAAGVKLFDNFWGLQSLIDFSIVQSEDILGDTLVLRLSNLSSRLSTPYKYQIDPSLFGTTIANVINKQLNINHNLVYGTTDLVETIDRIQLRPGMRMHLRAGYAADPNLLDTVFNGQITQVEVGEIITVTCQSDALELGAIVNYQNKKGNTGGLDGSLLGSMYLSEPRDLMIRLLTMGSSVVREAFASATGGKIFSENRFGIRHFGRMMYEPLTPYEEALQAKRDGHIAVALKGIDDAVQGEKVDANDPSDVHSSSNTTPVAATPAATGASNSDFANIIVNQGNASIGNQLFANLAKRKDYELFRRNIYPGNGFGADQYQGGDFGDIGTANADALVGAGSVGQGPVLSTGVDPTGTYTVNGVPYNPSDASILAALDKLKQANQMAQDDLVKAAHDPNGAGTLFENMSGFSAQLLSPNSKPNSGWGTTNVGFRAAHSILSDLHIVSDDGLGGASVPGAVCFRAETYMKSVWDLFQECAALLPNYIVAVRPFEDRSTVFYGKPHWTYTSGVIPVTTGVSEAAGPHIEVQDDEYLRIISDLSTQNIQTLVDNATKASTAPAFDPGIVSTAGGASSPADPNATSTGTAWDGTDISSLPLTFNNPDGSVATIPSRSGRCDIEMHLPTINGDVNHFHDPTLPTGEQHPYYMDRGSTHPGGSGPGKPGAFGLLTVDTEHWYMNQRWPTGRPYPNNYRGQGLRVMVYNMRTQKACICEPGEYGPSASTGKVAGVSPETWHYLAGTNQDTYVFGFVKKNYPLGPVNLSPSQNSDGTSAKGPAAAPGLASTAGDSKAAPGVFADGWHQGSHNDPYILPSTPYEQYYTGRDQSTGHSIWDEIRDRFYDSESTVAAYGSATGISVKANTNGKTSEAFNVGGISQQEATNRWTIFRRKVSDFMRTVWQDQMLRGWVMHVTDAVDSIQNITGIQATNKWNLSKIEELFQAWVKPFSGGPPGDSAAYGLDQAHKWASQHDSKGSSANNPISGAWEDIKQIGSDIWQAALSLYHVVADTVSGVIAALKLAIMNAMNAYSQTSQMQRYANLLNRVFNDSIYYSAGPPGSLLYLVDNPFTREYGEPVVEIREPFQRLHFIDSFHHILSNGIIEMGQVATVVTATSSGGKNVTAHFDKGAPAERQIEKTVESGLVWDRPHGFIDTLKSVATYSGNLKLLRQFRKDVTGNTDETSCERVAAWHLKESLKDIYGGELLVIGNAEIRPHDIVALADSFERCYGVFEVEQVVHHFSPETGFVTAITPNAVVSINDPGRWDSMTYFFHMNHIRNMRNKLRRMWGITTDGQPNLQSIMNTQIGADSTNTVQLQAIAEGIRDEIQNNIQVTGGSSALMGDFYSSLGAGVVIPNLVHSGANLLGQIPIPVLSSILKFDAFKWIKDHLLDQHSCFPAGTTILTNEGLKCIEKVHTGDMVFTHKARWRSVTNVMERDIEDVVYDITLNRMNAAKLQPTKDHPFLVFKEKRVKHGRILGQDILDQIEPEWISAQDIKVGDYLAIQGVEDIVFDVPVFDLSKYIDSKYYYVGEDFIQTKCAPTKNINRYVRITPDIMYAIGRYLGDGNIEFEDKGTTHRGIKYSFNRITEQDAIERIYKIFDIEFNLIGNKLESSKAHKTDYALFGSTPLARWMDDHFNHGFATKKMPEWVFSLPRDYIIQLLSGIFGADGCLANKYMKTGLTLKLDLSNKQLSFDVFRLLRNLKLFPSISGGHIQSGGTAPCYSTFIHSFALPELSESLGVFSYSKPARRGYINAGGYTAYRVSKIRKVPFKGPVYNLSVDEDESYIVDGVISHNCYINYLMRNGSPMDSGLSYNAGVAVGQPKVATLFKNLFGGIRVQINQDGTNRITLNEVLNGLGWSVRATQDAQAANNIFINEQYNMLLNYSGKAPESGSIGSVGVIWGKVTNVVDGDTFDIQVLSPSGSQLPTEAQTSPIKIALDLGSKVASVGQTIFGKGGGLMRVRLYYANAPEDKNKIGFDYKPSDYNIDFGVMADPGVYASAFARRELGNNLTAPNFVGKTVALRVDPNIVRAVDETHVRVLATVFYNLPVQAPLAGASPADFAQYELLRQNTLISYAADYPTILWDSYLSDGKPYTYNRALILAGLADIRVTELDAGNPNEGASGYLAISNPPKYRDIIG